MISSRITRFLRARLPKPSLIGGVLFCLWLPLLGASAQEFQGTTVLTPVSDEESGYYTAKVSFPQSFGRMPTVVVRANLPGAKPMRLDTASITTNGLEFRLHEEDFVPLPKTESQSDFGFPVNLHAATVNGSFPEDTSFGWVGQRMALVGLDWRAPWPWPWNGVKRTNALFVSLSGESRGLEGWTAHRVDLQPLLGAEESMDVLPLAVALVDQRMVVVWRRPGALCVSQSSGPLGELPWSTEVLTNSPPPAERASVAQVNGHLVVSLAWMEASQQAGRIQLSAWIRTAATPNAGWQETRFPEVVASRPYYSAAGVFATRVQQVRQQLMVSVGLFEPSSWISTQEFRGVAYLAEDLGNSFQWIQQWGWELAADPLGQKFELEGRPAKLNRKVGVIPSWDSGNVYPPELAVIPGEISWTAWAGPRLTTLGYNGGAGPFALGVGALGVTYQLLRSSSLSAPNWQKVGQPFGVESTGELRQQIPDFLEQHFYRVEELP